MRPPRQPRLSLGWTLDEIMALCLRDGLRSDVPMDADDWAILRQAVVEVERMTEQTS